MANIRYLQLETWMLGLKNPPNDVHAEHFKRVYPELGPSTLKNGQYLQPNIRIATIVVDGTAYLYDVPSFMGHLENLNTLEKIGSSEKLIALRDAEIAYYGKASEEVETRYRELWFKRNSMQSMKSIAMLKKRIKARKAEKQ